MGVTSTWEVFKAIKLIEITNIEMYIEKTKDQPWVHQQEGWKQTREQQKTLRRNH